MKIIPFEKMYYTNYYLRNISAVNRFWESEGCFSNSNSKPRMRSSLLYFRNCSVTNTYSDEEVHTIAQGSLVYYPAGLRYKTQFHNCKKDSISGQVLHFDLVDENGESFIASDKAIVLNSPNNPTGQIYSAQEIAALAEVLKKHSAANGRPIYLISDEPYRFLNFDGVEIPGVFQYYDASVVSDPGSLEQILSDCQKAGKNFYMEINNGWYQPAFFFGAGCTLTFSADRDGRITAVQCDYASENGVKALKSMITLSKSPAFVNGSSASNATNLGAIVDGTWDAAVLESMLGEHYATAKLPTVDGYQLGGFSGFKMLGVKPQTDQEKLALCDALALFLTEEAAQTARYEAVGWGPSNKNAQNAPAVQQDAALSALGIDANHIRIIGAADIVGVNRNIGHAAFVKSFIVSVFNFILLRF